MSFAGKVNETISRLARGRGVHRQGFWWHSACLGSWSILSLHSLGLHIAPGSSPCGFDHIKVWRSWKLVPGKKTSLDPGLGGQGQFLFGRFLPERCLGSQLQEV